MLGIKKLDFLVAMYIFCICVSELMGGKTFYLADLGFMKLNASVAIFVLPFIFTINDIVTEVYGAARTRSIVRSGLLIIFFLILFSLLATVLPPSSRFEFSEHAYDSVFGVSIRIAISSLISFALAEFLDILVFEKLREKLGKKRLWIRNNLSNFFAQFIDTTVFMTLAFYALQTSVGDNVSFLTSLILPYWLLKCFMSIIETPFVYAGVAWLRKDKEEETSIKK